MSFHFLHGVKIHFDYGVTQVSMRTLHAWSRTEVKNKRYRYIFNHASKRPLERTCCVSFSAENFQARTQVRRLSSSVTAFRGNEMKSWTLIPTQEWRVIVREHDWHESVQRNHCIEFVNLQAYVFPAIPSLTVLHKISFFLNILTLEVAWFDKSSTEHHFPVSVRRWARFSIRQGQIYIDIWDIRIVERIFVLQGNRHDLIDTGVLQYLSHLSPTAKTHSSSTLPTLVYESTTLSWPHEYYKKIFFKWH